MTLSIIIPALNAERFIGRSLQSALAAGAQVPGPWEIIVVDNGSTDRTIPLVREVMAKNPAHVRVITCARRGAAAARNEGAIHSNATWFQFLDADDTIDPDKIARQIAMAGEADWVVGAYRHLYPDGSTEDTVPHPDLWRGLFHGFRTGCTHSNLIRATALHRVNGWNEQLPTNQDPDLWLRLLRAGVSTVTDPIIGSYYHHHTGERITGSDPSGTYQRRVQMLATANAWLIENRPAYWQEHAPYFLGALLRSVRILATHDLESASQAYQAYFGRPNEWAIDRPYELVGRYTRLYPYLGFRNLEWSRRKLTRILPERWKRRLKA